jgi:hypothetical protein
MHALPLAVEWYKTAAGIIAIPTSLIGVLYAWRLAEKTRAETQKTRLEVTKLERELNDPDEPTITAAQVHAIASRSIASSETEGYLIRFIILYLVLSAWSAVQSVIDPLVSTFLGFGLLGLGSFVQIFENLIRLGIFVLIGLPLLLDVAKRFGLRPRDALQRPGT